MSGNKLTNIKIALLVFLFIVMFSFSYFLLYSSVKLDDNKLLTLTMIFTILVVTIPLFIFMDDKQSSIENLNKNTKKRKKEKKHG